MIHTASSETSALPALLKPPALRPGARIAVLSPASAANAERVRAGMEQLERMGFVPVLTPHALGASPLYYSGTREQRLSDLHGAFSDPTIDAITCTRGGWGSAELLPYLDLNLIRRNPKPLLGYSDVTSLHTTLLDELGLVTFYAPMIGPDFARTEGVDLASFDAALSTASPWQLDAAAGLRLLRPALDGRSIEAEGPLWGGCLAILAEALGTPYAPRPRGGILFLEDIHTKPYQWDRMLLHLRYAGLLAGVEAIVFGDMRQCVAPAEDALLEGALLHALADFAGPLCIGLRSGHVNTSNVTLPFGPRARLDTSDAENPTLHFLEAAVTLQPRTE